MSTYLLRKSLTLLIFRLSKTNFSIDEVKNRFYDNIKHISFSSIHRIMEIFPSFYRITFAIALSLPLVSSEFSIHFREFLIQMYGKTIQEKLERADMGLGMLGSFGGKMLPTDVVRNRPVIFVHGITYRAGNWVPIHLHFSLNGYNSMELFATTWGDGGITPLCEKTFTCEDVKQIRQFIIAVTEYTGSEVDIVAYSGGVAISRKAILGGACVDTGEELGDRLTGYVNTFVAVAGVAYGMETCLTQKGGNLINGVNCNSQYMRDINFPDSRYEGTFSYYIYSDTDEIIGQQCCGHLCPELKNAMGFSRQTNMPHANVILMTEDVQLKMVQHLWKSIPIVM